MATRLTLVDDDGNAMECFLNKNNTLQINVATDTEDCLSTASISLQKFHVQKLVRILSETLAKMEDSMTANESVFVE